MSSALYGNSKALVDPLEKPKNRLSYQGEMCTGGDLNSGNGNNASNNNFYRAIGPSCQALRHAVAALNRLDDFNCEKIGAGFFSEVFKVTHRTTGQVMVLKMNMSHSNRPNMLREVQLMNRLSHPNILRFMGVCVHEGQLHALTEFINGGSLEQLLLNKHEELTWETRIKLSLDIAIGMRYLHSRGIFHRDLTSKNVLIKQGEGDSMAVVGDFGLAEKIPDPLSKFRLPTVGSPYWMAPECLRGEWYNEKADVFSYGIILCEIIARIEADPDILPRTENFGLDYIAFSDLCPDCPPEFLQLAFTCCMIDPKKRSSFSGIVDQLQVIVADFAKLSMLQDSESVQNTYNCAETNYKMLHRRSKSEDTLLSPSNGFTPSDKARCHIHRPRSTTEAESHRLTPKRVGEVMSLGDPYYRPTGGNHNPFATLTQFRDGKKILATSRELFSSCLELPSPSSATTPPCTPFVDSQDDTVGAVPQVARRQLSRSNSLPSSPTLLRQTLERMQSCKETVCVESSRSLSPTPSTISPHLIAEAGVNLDFPAEANGAIEYEETSKILMGQTYPVLFRRGSCESGFFSVGEGDHMSTSDLSPELMLDDNSSSSGIGTSCACTSPRSSVLSENDADDDFVDGVSPIQSENSFSCSVTNICVHGRSLSESGRRNGFNGSIVRLRKNSRQERKSEFNRSSPSPVGCHEEPSDVSSHSVSKEQGDRDQDSKL